MIPSTHKLFGALFTSALLALLPVGCSKKSAPPEANATNAAAKPAIRDLGEMIFSGNEPIVEDIGDGKTATLTATALPDGSLQITATMEQRNASGEKTVLAMPRVMTLPGRPVEVSVNGSGLKFTPKLKGK